MKLIGKLVGIMLIIVLIVPIFTKGYPEWEIFNQKVTTGFEDLTSAVATFGVIANRGIQSYSREIRSNVVLYATPDECNTPEWRIIRTFVANLQGAAHEEGRINLRDALNACAAHRWTPMLGYLLVIQQQADTFTPIYGVQAQVTSEAINKLRTETLAR